jgi:hypothetical protein
VGNPLLNRDVRDIGRRLDAQAADVAFDDMLEQVAVVARDLDYERVAHQAQPPDGRVDEPPCMGHPRVAER